MKRALRWFAGVIAATVLLLALGVLVPRGPAVDAGAKTRRILLLANPIHTDIALPIDAGLLARFGDVVRLGVPAELAGARHLVFGWGGRAFYIGTPDWSRLRPGPLLKGLTVDAAAMHVAAAGDIRLPQDGVTVLDISEAGYQRLLDFVAASFTRGPDGPILIAGAGYDAFDQFFEANGRFTALLGCNTWTSAALREAGIVTGWWTPLPQLLDASLRLHGATR